MARAILSGSVPISIAVHLGAVLVFVIIPLTANMILPDPAEHVPDYMECCAPLASRVAHPPNGQSSASWPCLMLCNCRSRAVLLNRCRA